MGDDSLDEANPSSLAVEPVTEVVGVTVVEVLTDVVVEWVGNTDGIARVELFPDVADELGAPGESVAPVTAEVPGWPTLPVPSPEVQEVTKAVMTTRPDARMVHMIG